MIKIEIEKLFVALNIHISYDDSYLCVSIQFHHTSKKNYIVKKMCAHILNLLNCCGKKWFMDK